MAGSAERRYHVSLPRVIVSTTRSVPVPSRSTVGWPGCDKRVEVPLNSHALPTARGTTPSEPSDWLAGMGSGPDESQPATISAARASERTERMDARGKGAYRMRRLVSGGWRRGV